jgi:hypothetical protein
MWPAALSLASFLLHFMLQYSTAPTQAMQQSGDNPAVQRVPAVKDLPAIVSAMLVKPIPPALDASGEGLFTTVIPDNRCAPRISLF